MLVSEALFKFQIYLPDFEPKTSHEFIKIDFENEYVKGYLNSKFNREISNISPSRDVILLTGEDFFINIPNMRLPNEFFVIFKNNPNHRMCPIGFPSVRYVLKDKNNYFDILSKFSNIEKENDNPEYEQQIKIL